MIFKFEVTKGGLYEKNDRNDPESSKVVCGFHQADMFLAISNVRLIGLYAAGTENKAKLG